MFHHHMRKNRARLFGEINDEKSALNDGGQMVEKWHREFEKFPDIRCHEMVVMPNHFHCIIENVEADQRVRPYNENGQYVRADLRVRPDTQNSQPHSGGPACPPKYPKQPTKRTGGPAFPPKYPP